MVAALDGARRRGRQIGARMMLVFGKTGQVARELAALGGAGVGRDLADLTDPAACAALIHTRQPAAVINAAAYTAVDRAETQETLAHRINADAPAAMARACADLGIPFIHISTDYVFSGQGTAPHLPGDPTAPQNAYGRSKLAGEEAVRAAGGAHAILRTSWVVSAHGSNFVKTMVRLGAGRDRLPVVADQTGGLTPAHAIAAACMTIARALIADPGKTGTYHLSGTPDATWADVARVIIAQAGLDCTITDIPSSDYPTPAIRPANSRLDCTTSNTVFGIHRPDWRAGVAHIVKEIQDAT
jgi:dTDP-4-dehydrorhamnose reductase